MLSSTHKRRDRPTKGLDFTAELADQYVDGDDAYMCYNNSAMLHRCRSCSWPSSDVLGERSERCRVVWLQGSNFVTSAEEIKKKKPTTKNERGALASFDCDQV